MGDLFSDIGGALLGPQNIIAGATSFGGSLINAQAQRQQNERNEQNVWEMQRRTEQREDSAHQREQADMLKAGLNPILGLGGKGAASSSQSAPVAQAPQIDLMSMMSSLKNIAEINKINAETDILTPQAQIAKHASSGVSTIDGIINNIGNVIKDITENVSDYSSDYETDKRRENEEKISNDWSKLNEKGYYKPDQQKPKTGYKVAAKYLAADKKVGKKFNKKEKK